MSGARIRRFMSLDLPTGLRIELELASLSARFLAFFVDLVVLLGVLLALFLVATLLSLFAGGEASELPAVGPVAAVLVFVIYQFGFALLELKGQGRSLGKRANGLRVVDAKGGQLSIEALVLRNLTRDLEVAWPAAAVLAPDSIWPGVPGYWQIGLGIWLLIVAFLPLFSREGTRVGDLIAGTRVIREPKVRLLPDLSLRGVARGDTRATPKFSFTRDQLDVYGIFELEALEEFLRTIPANTEDEGARVIAAKVQKRLGYSETAAARGSPREFLFDFYAAQRGRLEDQLLLGHRRERKRAKNTGENPPLPPGPPDKLHP